jgi:hypothetical protein
MEGQVPVAYTYNPSYLGGSDQEDFGLKPAPAKLLVRPYLEKTYHTQRKGWHSGSSGDST